MKFKISTLFLLTFVVYATFANPREPKYKERCSTLSCVYASATIIQKMNTELDPCDDFYQYACGTFMEEQHTPDEKSTVNTLALMSDKLTEYLLTLLLKPSDGSEIHLHKLAKNLFTSCLNADRVNERGKEPIINLIKATGQWPMLEGKNWDETQFDVKKTILNFRKYISKSDEDIFASGTETNEVRARNQNFADDEADLAKVQEGLKALIQSIVTSLNAEDTPELEQEIEDMIEFEKELDTYQRKFARFKKQHSANFKNKTSGYKAVNEFKSTYKYILFLDLIEPFVMADSSRYTDDVPITFNVEFNEFIKKTPKRTIANYVFWRIVQSSLQFLDKDLRNIVLTFEKDAYGKEDYEQRWILCTNIATNLAPVAIGSLYISQYFTAEDKDNAERLVDYILKEYINTIKSSTWMEDDVKQRALEKASKMSRFIGYDEKLRTLEAENFYDSLPSLSNDNFLEMGLAFKVFSADREFTRLHDKKLKNKKDWTKYSKPATVNALYNSKDNSIQFPAAILQTPNFDKDRPPYMNFGAIGSIIGHEITHAFDDQASKYETWSKEAIEAYKAKVNCIINQYSSYRVTEVEEYFADEKIGKFHLDGNFTQKEDIADCGGVKLSLHAFKKFADEFPESKVIPIGLQDFDQNKIFFLSYAQTFCSVERAERMKNKVGTDIHSLDRFRVIGTLSNMQEFADAFNCPEGSNMNPKNKCAVW